jgi:ribosomal protein L37AE/L43A
MIDSDKCPMCADGEVTRSEGRLDQSGATYLPTNVWTCKVCGYVRFDPAMAARWLPLYGDEEVTHPQGEERRAA